MSKPAIVVRDLNLVKDILTSHFSSFHDNDFIIDFNLDPLFKSNPFVNPGDQWKKMRAQSSMIFTPSRIKPLFPLIKNVSDNLVEYIRNGPESNSKDGFETKQLGTQFTIDNIASCCFGVEAESFTNPNSEFKQMSREIFDPSFIGAIRATIVLFVPVVGKIIRMGFVSKKINDWVIGMIKGVIDYREKEKIERNDLLQAVLQMREKESKYIIIKRIKYNKIIAFHYL